MNEAAALRFGLPMEQLVGTNVYDLFSAETVQSRKERLARIFETSQPAQTHLDLIDG